MQKDNKKVDITNSAPKEIDKFKLRKIISGFFIGLSVFILMTIAFCFGWFEDFEQTTLKWRFNYFNTTSKPSDKCLILGIDSESGNLYGRWPWDRSVFADMVDGLNFYGARSVVFDLSFPLRSTSRPQGDLNFVEAVKRFQDNGKSVVIGSAIDIADKSVKYYSKADLERLEKLSIKSANNLKAIAPDELFYHITNYEKFYKQLVLQKPYKELFYVVNSIGLFNVGYANKDAILPKNKRPLRGDITRIPLVVKFNSMYFPALSLQAFLDTKKNQTLVQKQGYLLAGNQKIQVVGKNEYIINWYKAPANREKPYDSISISEVVESYRFLKDASNRTGMPMKTMQKKIEQLFACHPQNNCSESLLAFEKQFPAKAKVTNSTYYKNKIVFVGIMDQFAGGTKDLINTPIMQDMPGVFLHANVVDNMIQNDFIKKTPDYLAIIIMFLLCVSAGITLTGVKSPIHSMGIGSIYLFYFILPIILFNYFHIYTDLFYTQSAIIFTFLTCIAYQFWITDVDKKAIRQTLGNYLSPQVLTEVLSDPTKVKLGGDRMEISILFSDIRGFTTISEQSEPEHVVEILLEYFDAMVDEVLKTEGTIDKFIGDAVMAFWGAPLEYDNHAEKAVRGALGMIEALNNLKAKWKAEGKEYPEINIGIGINTGPAIVGNVGSSKLKNYTIIGDSVNLASRLEGLNKKYATHEENEKNIIISEYTYEHIKDLFEVKYLGEETVKGKDIAVKIYKVIGTK